VAKVSHSTNLGEIFSFSNDFKSDSSLPLSSPPSSCPNEQSSTQAAQERLR